MQAIGLTKTNGAVKAKSSVCLREDPLQAHSCKFHPRNVGSMQSINIGTREMVNYAWLG